MAGDARGEDKRREIVRQAFDRFYDGGFHATGVDAVLAESGISKRTLYKYFPTKDDLIEAVLDHYGQIIVGKLFDPVAAANEDPRRQIIAFFDARKEMIDQNPTRGCLGIKAAQEFAGRHAGLAAQGKRAALYVERRFVELCERAGFEKPVELGAQINVLFQGALLLSQVYGDSSPFVSAKRTVVALLEAAEGPTALGRTPDRS
jgi:AcrR family transcriptional regulator